MATKTAKKKAAKPRKPGSNPVHKKKVVAGRPSDSKPNGVADVPAKTHPAPNQPTIPGLEDTDERVPDLERLCQKVLADREKKASLSDAIVSDLEEIGDLLGEHNLDCYIVSGRKFFISPAESHVKITKVKQG